ncbi:MAG: N-acetylmuramoyl-L-alanine amidase [Chloroflexi bacterium]|nr:N-acetylmuramoyl-L-alanine amidase [Chloroflexota bacterium]
MVPCPNMGLVRGKALTIAALVLFAALAGSGGLSWCGTLIDQGCGALINQGPTGLAASRHFPSGQLSTPTVRGAELSLTAEDLRRSTLSSITVLDGRVQVTPNTTGVLISPPVRSTLPFSHVGMRWRGDTTGDGNAAFELRASRDGTTWTPWFAVEEDDDLQFGADGRSLTRLLSLDPRSGLYNYAQARVTLSSGVAAPSPSLSSIAFSFIDPTGGPSTTDALQALALATSTGGPQAIARPPVISRSAWGSPDGQSSPGWPPEYRPVTNIIVHHTDTSNGATNWAAEVRAIWYYHAISNGWGDIGYNFLIDPGGNVYEGRAGGDDVVGGHALRYNNGTLGVALLGDFTPVSPSSSAQNSLVGLLSWKAEQRGIDPTAMSTYLVDRWVPSILGHRDVLGTSCPGSYLYSLLPQLRTAIRDRILANPASAEILATTFEPTRLPSGDVLRVAVTVRNNGSVAIQTQDPAPGFVYNEGETFLAQFSESYGKLRVGADYAGRSGIVDHPYRWGLGRELAPGETTTVVGYIRLSTLRSANYWAGLVRESVAWLADGTGNTTVQVVASDTAPPTSAVSALLPYQNTTGFVVRWSGADNPGGTGIVGYVIQYKDGATGTPRDWLTATSLTQAIFAGESGHTYYFRSLARDNVGNVETKAADRWDTFTTIDTIPPIIVISAPQSPTHSWFAVTWSGSDGLSGLVPSYDMDYSADAVNWRAWVQASSSTGTLFLIGTPGQAYYFRVRARDAAGNLGSTIAGPVIAGYDQSGPNRAWFAAAFNGYLAGW